MAIVFPGNGLAAWGRSAASRRSVPAKQLPSTIRHRYCFPRRLGRSTFNQGANAGGRMLSHALMPDLLLYHYLFSTTEFRNRKVERIHTKTGNSYTDTATTQKQPAMAVLATNPVVITPSLSPPESLKKLKVNGQ